MAKTESAKKVTPPEAESEKEVSPPVEDVPQSQPVITFQPIASPGPLVPFDRWFRTRGFKERWKSGMIAFTDVSVRRTMLEWDAIFRSY